MYFNKPVTDLIKKRISVRSYKKEKISPDLEKQVKSILGARQYNVFGTKPRFIFLDAGDLKPDEIKNLGTYGMINGARYYIAGTTRQQDGKKGIIDFGCAFEDIILKMTGLGLGTCWLGGTFNRKGFSDRIGLEEGEIIPGVSPVGSSLEKKKIKDSAIRILVRADKRKSWDKIFFQGDFLHPLTKDKAGDYRVPLEMLRRGPSASNLQPWRILIEDRNTIHFFVKKSRAYQKKPDHLNLQYIDMGICMCHFGLTCLELELEGSWQVIEGLEKDKKYNIPPNTEYIISWVK